MVDPRGVFRAPWAKRLLSAATAAGALTLAIVAAPASAATLPTQGIFEGCPFETAAATCQQRLEMMHSGGLQVVVIPVGNRPLDSIAQYAAAAHSTGMSVMWELSNPLWWQQPANGTQASHDYSAFSAACGCSTNGEVLAYMVRWLAALPGTYGYYAADDSMLAPGDSAGVSAYTARIKQADAGHTVLIGAANTIQGRQYQHSADLVGQEIYPVTTRSLLPQSANQSTWDIEAATAQATQNSADQAGKGSAVILQAFTWGDNVADGSAIGVCSSSDSTAACNAKLRYPSGAEQLALRNAVLRNSHPQLILWFSFYGTYGSVEQDSYFAPIGPDEGAARWAGLSAAIKAPLPAAAVANAASTHKSARAGRHKKHAHKAAHHKKHKKHKKHRKHSKHT